MKNFFTLDFWFNIRPGELLGSSLKALVLLVILLVAATLVSGSLKKRKGLYRKTWERLFNFFTTNAVIGLLLLFFTYETVLFLSARFWFLLWALEIIVWLGFIYKQAKELPKLKEQREAENKYKQYLPK
ncbi:MAG: hypothetical protein UT48_C0001G0073 [Parcubacteria group bacterium GW2011_GWE2_39_37]|uniref:Uncharacterized protein n=1 Tax=Candidatus Falkowbacteria bacterium GW2011_GWF2_39_8 TaxID=1618642 RepID=A0A0G0Q0N3_9BACT|nr:MAG: hypothetical protein UT48_C0001G0073 [Parcubacteria group bacterium GW2011_GWE2_39_37]KKR33718.1 MAG: hypothetical protein UT64_C0004G0025 [Candidatus Falkowbacteria bacterium GW2011_GWF2_39_8]